MRLRVATFNLENLDEWRRGVPLARRIEVLRPQLLALRADILCLQEVSAHTRHQGHRALRALDQLLDRTPYASFARATTHAVSGQPNDKHNLVVLSRWPIIAEQQHHHDLVAPPTVRLGTTPAPHDTLVRWDRPVLEVQIALPGGRPLAVFDAHLRAPLAASIDGQKLAPLVWRTTEGWAEGYLVAAIKRAGQALELRRHVDRVLDDDPGALVLVAGDLNAGADSSAYRILRASVDDTGNPALATRSLIALEERVEEERRYTLVHGGRRLLLDHLLASPALARAHLGSEIFNDELEDEVEVQAAGREPVGSMHAAVVAELELPVAAAPAPRA